MKATSWVEVDLGAIRANMQHIRQWTGRPVIAVVKANAYGHGMGEVSRAIADQVAMFAVATVEEALELLSVVPNVPLLNLFPVLPDQAEPIVRNGIHQIVHSVEALMMLEKTAVRMGCEVFAHLKVDTGMHRVGVPYHEVGSFLEALARCPHVRLEGVATHLACADDLESDFTEVQLRRFRKALEQVAQAGFRPPWIHAANSAGLLHWPASHFTAVRPGLVIYGLRPVPGVSLPFEPKPALTWKSRVIQVHRVAAGETIGYGGTYATPREVRVATIPVGYADGYRRALSNRGRVLIRGQFAPIVGRVCMDQIMGDVSAIEGVQVGDEVVLLGQQGENVIPAEEHARLADTIHYEILTGIGPRVRREYRGVVPHCSIDP